jgi:hypothetical protein
MWNDSGELQGHLDVYGSIEINWRFVLKHKRFVVLISFLLLLLSSQVRGETSCANANPGVPETTPTSAFVDNHDGTVTDTHTWLTWMRCSLGQSWDNVNSTCTGTAGTYGWGNALQAALDMNSGAADPDGDGQNGFAGHTDWRLPNPPELNSIVEEHCWSPAVNGALFPNTPTTGSFWSSSPWLKFPTYAWCVSFSSGIDTAENKTMAFYVRLVRGGQ